MFPWVFFPRMDAARLALHVLAAPPVGNVAAREVITGYDDHQRRESEMASGPHSDSLFLIGRIAHQFVVTLRSSAPIREIWIIGHSDRVRTPTGHNAADELSVSNDRARDVREELLAAIIRDPDGLFTPIQLADAIKTGKLNVLAAGVGSRFPLGSSSQAEPANRRVEIVLLFKQSIPI
jgi:hypothetical protein